MPLLSLAYGSLRSPNERRRAALGLPELGANPDDGPETFRPNAGLGPNRCEECLRFAGLAPTPSSDYGDR